MIPWYCLQLAVGLAVALLSIGIGALVDWWIERSLRISQEEMEESLW